MKQFLKRAGALALSLVLLLGSANLGMVVPARAAGNTDGLDPAAAQAYAKVLQNIISKYGICNAAAGSDEFVVSDYYSDGLSALTGLAYARLVDFDSDGVQELYLYYITNYSYWGDGDDANAAEEEIWYWNGSSASKVYSNSMTYYSVNEGYVDEAIYLYQKDGKVYLTFSAHGGDHASYIDSQVLMQFKNGEFVEYQSIEEDGDVGLDPYYRLTINGTELIYETYSPEDDYTFPEDPRVKEFYDRYPLPESDMLIESGNSRLRWRTNDVSALLAQLQARAASGVSGTDLLNNIAYIGDRGKCKMDAKMARAYAEVIETLPTTIDPTEWYHGTLYVALADFADDGYPILITTYLDKTQTSGDQWCDTEKYGYIIESPTFWGYKNGTAYNANINLHRENGYGTLNGKNVIYVREWYAAIEEERNRWYYTVSNGQIESIHTITLYDAYQWDSSGVVEGPAPKGASYKLSEYTLDGSKLAQNGWIERIEGDSSVWYLALYNGKNVTQQYINNIASAYESDKWILGSEVEVKEVLAHIDDVEYHINFETTSASTAASILRAYADGAPATNAVLSPQKLTVDGRSIECEKYNIGGSNYFKLRDLAYLLNGTGSQFEVGYNQATSTVTITTGAAYTPTGTELTTNVDNSSTAQPSSQSILVDGAAHGELTVYNIGGSNFFQLRELGSVLGFEVDFDVSSNTAIVRSAAIK